MERTLLILASLFILVVKRGFEQEETERRGRRVCIFQVFSREFAVRKYFSKKAHRSAQMRTDGALVKVQSGMTFASRKVGGTEMNESQHFGGGGAVSSR